jgi:hypothetical protein
VVDAVHAHRVVGDERARLGHDRLADPANVLDPGQAGREVLDRPEPGGEVLDGRHEPGIADGGCDRVAEAPREGRLVRGPVVRLAVVEHEQRQRGATEHGGHEAQRGNAVLGIDRAHLRGDRRVVGVAIDDDGLAAERLEARQLRVLR